MISKYPMLSNAGRVALTSCPAVLAIALLSGCEQQVADFESNRLAAYEDAVAAVEPIGSDYVAPEGVTPIHAVQGSGDATPMAGQVVTIEGVVTADFRSTKGGIYIQQHDGAHDNDPRTSEGIYVFNRGNFPSDLAPGSLVRVTGTAMEFNGQTQIANPSEILVSGPGTASPIEITLPLEDPSHWEYYEGMLVTINQPLVVADTYNLARFGSFYVAAEDRPMIPTAVARPGDEAREVMERNARHTILIDDGSHSQNPIPVPHVGDGRIRVGDTVPSVTGVVAYAFDEYAIHPVEPLQFQHTNPRPELPPDVGGSLKVAGFNVENYFNGDGRGGGFPTPRGAETPEEFERQRAKTITAINTMGADIVGLMEMENDGYDEYSAIADLVRGLNESAPDGITWDFIRGDDPLGTDAIRVAAIYNTETVSPVGERVGIFGTEFESLNRVPLVQTFEETATGERLTIVVNHLKAKGCRGAEGPEADQGDGQSCWAPARTRAARAIVNFIADDEARSGSSNYLVLGDLNSYRLEDPLQVFYEAGFVDLHWHFNPDHEGTYVFRGQSGSLDYILASPSMVEVATGCDDWDINADEPRYMGYEKAYDSIRPFEPNVFRSSDHDPIVAGFNLGGE